MGLFGHNMLLFSAIYEMNTLLDVKNYRLMILNQFDSVKVRGNRILCSFDRQL